jgi:hypothetical protein
MRIVFDEVVGSVERGSGPAQESQAQEPPEHEEGSHSLQVHVDEIEREQRLRQRRHARLQAD